MKTIREGFYGEEMEMKSHPFLPIQFRSDGLVCRECKKSMYFTPGTKQNRGYMCIGIGGKNFLVHRLIAETFIPNPCGKPTVDHINRVRTDNRVENLRWATYREQRDNSIQILNAVDYGVRSCDDKKAYRHARYEAKKELIKEYHRQYYLEHKARFKERNHVNYLKRKSK